MFLYILLNINRVSGIEKLNDLIEKQPGALLFVFFYNKNAFFDHTVYKQKVKH